MAKNSDHLTTREVMQQTVNDIAKDSGPGNQCGPKGPPKLTVPEHMRGLITDTAPAARARQAEEDRNRFGALPKATKP